MHAVSHKRDDLFYTHSQVMLVARAHSELFQQLSTVECKLFGDFLRTLERHIRPGLTKITWSSRPKVVDQFTEVGCTSISL